jgi:hypothetical protein
VPCELNTGKNVSFPISVIIIHRARPCNGNEIFADDYRMIMMMIIIKG